MSQSYHYISDNNLFFVHAGETRTMTSDDSNFAAVATALHHDDYQMALQLSNLETTTNAYFEDKEIGDYRVKGGAVRFRGKPLRSELNTRVLEMVRVGADMTAMTAFIERLVANTSSRVQEQLYPFLMRNNLPIMEDGRLIMYKRIRDDWKDCHSGTIDNSVGQVVAVERDQVDDDPSRSCSHGLHVCSIDYLKHFHGDRLVACAVDPADVVAIPYDYDNSKVRVCRYEVINELPISIVRTQESPWSSPLVDCEGRDLYEEEEDDDEDTWEDSEEYDEEEDEEVPESRAEVHAKTQLEELKALLSSWIKRS